MTGNTIILEGQHKYIDTKLQKHKFYDSIDTGKQCNVIYGIKALIHFYKRHKDHGSLG